MEEGQESGGFLEKLGRLLRFKPQHPAQPNATETPHPVDRSPLMATPTPERPTATSPSTPPTTTSPAAAPTRPPTKA